MKRAWLYTSIFFLLIIPAAIGIFVVLNAEQDCELFKNLRGPNGEGMVVASGGLLNFLSVGCWLYSLLYLGIGGRIFLQAGQSTKPRQNKVAGLVFLTVACLFMLFPFATFKNPFGLLCPTISFLLPWLCAAKLSLLDKKGALVRKLFIIVVAAPVAAVLLWLIYFNGYKLAAAFYSSCP